jgi:signal peptidase I
MPRARPPEAVVAATQALVATAWCLSVLALLLIGILPHTGRYRTLTVLSGSMKPSFSPGDLIVTTPKSPDSVQVGDVVVFSIPVEDHRTESHRVVEILRRKPTLVVRTRGDANGAADPWVADLGSSKVWTVSMSLPALGWPIHWLRTPLLRWLLVLGGPAVLAVMGLRRIWSSDGPGVHARA